MRQAFDINEGVYLAALHLLAGVVTHCVLFTPARGSPLSAAFSDWLSMIAAVGRPRGRAPRAAPYEVLPRCAPRPRRAGTAGRYCRRSSAEETGRAADTATDSPCVGDRRLRSSPRACPSCAAAPRTSRPGSTAPDAPTAHRSDRWEGPLPTACSRPMRLGPHPESKPPSHLGGRKSHPAPPARNFWVRLSVSRFKMRYFRWSPD